MSPLEFHVRAGVLHFRKPFQYFITFGVHPFFDNQVHIQIVLRRAYAVNAGDRGHNDGIPSFEDRPCRRMSQPVYVVIDHGIFFYIRVGCRDISLGLIVVVVADKEFNCVLREKLFELSVKLCREGLVMGYYKGRPVDDLRSHSRP